MDSSFAPGKAKVRYTVRRREPSANRESRERGTVEAIQVGARGVNLAITGSRYGPGGTRIHSIDAVYLITEVEGRWGIRAGSGMSPRP